MVVDRIYYDCKYWETIVPKLKRYVIGSENEVEILSFHLTLFK